MKVFVLLIVSIIFAVSLGHVTTNRKQEQSRDAIEALLRESLEHGLKIDKRIIQVAAIPLAAVYGACKLRDKVRETYQLERDNSTGEATIDTVCQVTDIAQEGVTSFLTNPLGAVCSGKKLVDSLSQPKVNKVHKRFWDALKSLDIQSHFTKLCD